MKDILRLFSSHLVGPILIVATVALMAAWTWETWPDVIIDFGQQLYLSWRLSEGQVLYRDLAYYNGPLSLYANALLFRAFGTNLRVLEIANFAILGLFLYVLFKIGVSVASRRSATAACIWFSTLCAFGQYVGIGNYNFICPYTHEMTHGLLLSLLSLLMCWRAEPSKAGYTLASGLALGLAFLTKAEVFQAGAAGVMTYFWGTIASGVASRRAAITFLALLFFSFALAPLVALVALASAMPLEQAMRGTLGSWVGSFTRQLVSGPYFQWSMGVDDIASSLRVIAQWLGWYACLTLIPAGFSYLQRRRSQSARHVTSLAVFLLVTAIVLWNPFQLDWLDAFRPLPILLVLIAVPPFVSLMRLSREETTDVRERRMLALRQLSLMTCSLFLLAKMILNARIWHYGFVLAAPGSCVLVIALTEWIPDQLKRGGVPANVVQAAAWAFLVAAGASYLRMERVWLAGKTCRVGRGADTFWADERGRYVSATLAELSRRSSEQPTLACLPEGVMLNYLLRRINPTPYTVVQTTEMILYGNDAILSGFRSHPPDWIAIVHKDTGEFGVRIFGRDYARTLGRWIRDHYHSEVCVGAMPLKNDDFGIHLLRRNRQLD